MSKNMENAFDYFTALSSQLVTNTFEARAMTVVLLEELVKSIAKLEGVSEEVVLERIMSRYEHVKDEKFNEFKVAVFGTNDLSKL